MPARILRAAGMELVFGAHLTALAIVGMLASLLMFLGRPLTLPLLLVSYLVPLSIYNLDRLKGLKADATTNAERSTHLGQRVTWRIALVIGYIVALLGIAVLATPPRVAAVAVMLLLAGLLYPKRLTAIIPAFKSLYVAASITSIGLLAIVDSLPKITVGLVAAWCSLYLRVLVSAVYSDIKDVESDGAEGLRTVPVMLGRGGATRFLHIVNLLSFLPIVVAAAVGRLPLWSLSLLVFVPYVFVALRRKDGAFGGADIALEFEFVLWPLALSLGALVAR